jgi:hypothetical protein
VIGLTHAELRLRAKALSTAELLVPRPSTRLPVNVRQSIVGRKALNYIIQKRGLYTRNLAVVAREWQLQVHPRDLDQEVPEDFGPGAGGRQLLYYGDLDPKSTELEERRTRVKREEDLLSTSVGTSEDSTIIEEDVDQTGTRGGKFWDVSGSAGRKRIADEMDVDDSKRWAEAERETKRMRML